MGWVLCWWSSRVLMLEEKLRVLCGANRPSPTSRPLLRDVVKTPPDGLTENEQIHPSSNPSQERSRYET